MRVRRFNPEDDSEETIAGFIGEHDTVFVIPFGSSMIAIAADHKRVLPLRTASKFPLDLPEVMREIEKNLLEMALQKTNFDLSSSARLLGIKYLELRDKIREHGLRLPVQE